MDTQNQRSTAMRHPGVPSRRPGRIGITDFPRFRDLGGKAWKYLLAALERPWQIPDLVALRVKGVHVGEFQKMNQRFIKEADIKTVIDIGAHTGESSSAFRALLPQAHIYAFEPLTDCYEKLGKRMGKSAAFDAFNVALGNEHGQVVFWRSEFSKSSSVLPMAKLHREAFPWTARTIPTSVEMRKLDDYLDRLKLIPKVLLKIDVQGYEHTVLQGGSRLADHVDYVLIEVSFAPLYEGQALFDDVYSLLAQWGFSYAGNLDQLLSPSDGRIVQADALFIRKAQRSII